MPTIDLNPYAPEPLTLTIGDRDWVVPPPSAIDGTVLTCLITFSAAGEISPEAVADLPEKVVQTLREHAEDDIADLALTKDVHQQMVDAGLPAPMIDRAAQAAAFYWVTGSTTAATGVLDAITGRAATLPEGAHPKESSGPRRTGPRTASDSRTPTAGTPTTGRRPPTSDHRPPQSRKGRSGRRSPR